MTKKAKEALKKSIAHWQHMVVWAKKQNKKAKVDNYNKMFTEIDEVPSSVHCECCQQYFREGRCGRCPLNKKYNCFKKDSPYQKCIELETWGCFVKNGTAFIKIMKGILK